MTAVEEFWGETVLAGPFNDIGDSVRSFAQRSRRYRELYNLMPVNLPGKVVLDYGCGPGHDTLGFAIFGAIVLYADVSAKARAITRHRLVLHGFDVEAGNEVVVFDDAPSDLPSVNYIHCAGVLHHTSEPDRILSEFRNALDYGGKCLGECRIMVYDGDRSEHTQSAVPVTHWWGAEDMTRMAAAAGFTVVEYLGGYDCSAPWRPNCRAACWKLT